MQDSVYLLVDGKRIENFEAYTVEADIYTADDAFSLELSNPEIKVREGLSCELYVNDTLELTGIIDRIATSYDKSGVKLKVEGRDLMGLLVDSFCEEFITIEGMQLKTLAQRLLKNVPFINRKDIVYQQNIKGKLKGKAASSNPLDIAQNLSQIEPGMTIFECLKEYAHSRGLMFWAMPDGKLIFGRPLAGGESSFSIINRKKESSENNAVKGEEDINISKQYSKVTVVGQQQGLNIFGASSLNTKATLENKQWPFYEDGKLRMYKPFIAKNNNDSQSPKLHARLLLEKQKFEGYHLSYKVAGHSQSGRNWGINQMCHVEDEVFDVNDNFLIYGRTFTMSKKEGVLTSLKLGYPGVVQ